VDIPQSNYKVDYSNIVTLECIVSGTPAATRVYWEFEKDGVTTEIDMSNSVKYTGSTVGTPSLTINNAVLEDEGVYKCFAINIVGLGESNPTTLDVVGSKYSVIVTNTRIAYDTSNNIILWTTNPLLT
jgi:hypothetical protein